MVLGPRLVIAGTQSGAGKTTVPTGLMAAFDGRGRGNRRAATTAASPLGPGGLELRGHEFHYSAVTPPGDGLELASMGHTAPGGWARPGLLASYLHLHVGAAPELAGAFTHRAAATREEGLRR